MATQLSPSVGYQRHSQQLSESLSPEQLAGAKSARGNLQYAASRINDILKKLTNVTPRALYLATKPIFDKSQYYVPVDTGRLKKSGFHEVHKGQRARVNIGYAKGGNPFYALVVHERYDLEHDEPTRAGYLIQALREHEQDIVDIMAKHLERTLAKA